MTMHKWALAELALLLTPGVIDAIRTELGDDYAAPIEAAVTRAEELPPEQVQDDKRAWRTLQNDGTRGVVRIAVETLTGASRGGRDPVDALADAEHVLAAVRHWARQRAPELGI